MSHQKCCHKTDLVRNKALQITHCSCGMIQLHMGPVSLRISEAAFSGLADAMTQARLQLENQQANRNMIITTPVHGSEFVAG